MLRYTIAAAATALIVASTQPAGGTSQPRNTVNSVTKPVTDAVDTTVQQVTNTLPAPVASPVQSVVEDVTSTVDDATKAVDGVLPKP